MPSRTNVVILDENGITKNDATETVDMGSAPMIGSSSASYINPINPKQYPIGKNNNELEAAFVEERSNAKGNEYDKVNKEKKPAMKNEKKKRNQQHPSNLTPDDLTAIKTVQYACFWYLILTVSAVLLHSAARNIGGETTFELARNRIFGQIAKVLAVSNNSFNFCFYMRAKSFRSTFKERWF